MSMKTCTQHFLVYSIYLQRYIALVSGKMLVVNFKIQSAILEKRIKQAQARSFNVSLKYPIPFPGKRPFTCNKLTGCIFR
jgi:hypothetical protein